MKPLLLSLALLFADQARAGTVDLFSSETEAGGLPKGWKPLAFRKTSTATKYSVEREGGDYFVKAVSEKAGAGILKNTVLRVQDYPILTWRWKISNVLEKADVRRKSGDDFSARVWVAFFSDSEKMGVFEALKFKAAKARFGELLPTSVLMYVWDNKNPVGKVYDNAFNHKAKMVIVESGPQKAGEWVRERRNVYDDYKNFIGGEPPETIFVAVMTDTDNTKESATAYYDDIVFSPEP